MGLLTWLRYIMKYFEKQAKAQKNKVVMRILQALQCCILCFERCVKFLNKNAYIQIAVRGTNFCASAKKAFEIITQNFARFGILATLGYAIHFIGYVFIISATMVLGYLIAKELHPTISLAVPLVMYFCLGYIVGNLYMNVFGMAVDTSLQCVIFAEEKGIGEKVCPHELKRILNKSMQERVEKTG